MDEILSISNGGVAPRAPLSPREQLERAARAGRNALAACDSFVGLLGKEPPPDLDKRLTEVRRAARILLETAQAPIKIGVVGEFSAGKSLLLGSLIGFADLLPIDEAPSTGNVTALHFEQHDDLRPTEVDLVEVEYMDDRSVSRCLTFMLQEARKKALIAQVPEELVTELNEELLDAVADLRPEEFDTAAQEIFEPIISPTTLAKIQRWCAKVWGPTSNPGLRNLLSELLAFVQAFIRCGNAFCRDKRLWRFEGAEQVAKARRGLELDKNKRDLQGLTFDQLPPAPREIALSPEELSESALRATFPLIRRVKIVVRVSREIWDFSTLSAGNQFVLLDFPGLGADSSCTRDLYLCLTEMREVQTILIILRGDKAGGDAGTKLFDLMQSNHPTASMKDNILVGVGRFDQLPLQEAGEQALQRLAESVTPTAPKPAPAGKFAAASNKSGGPSPVAAKLTEAQIIENVGILHTCLAGPEALVAKDRMDRVVFLSPMWYFKTLQHPFPTLQTSSETFASHLAGNTAKATTLARWWRAVADGLERTNPEAAAKPGLARWLRDFANDGGITRLRELLRSHVAGHGLEQLLQTVQQKVTDLKRAHKALLEMLPPPPPKTQEDKTLEDRIQSARLKLQQISKDYREVHEQLRRQPDLRLQRNGREMFVQDALLEDVIFEVSRWPQWKALYSRCKNGIITEPDKKAGKSKFADPKKSASEESPTASTNFPTCSEDFFAVFAQSYADLQGQTNKILEAGVDFWLQHTGERSGIAAAHDVLAGLLESPTLDERLEPLRITLEGVIPALQAAINPTKLKSLILDLPEEPPAPALTRPKAEGLFPLARKEANAKQDAPGLLFPWAKEVRNQPKESRPEEHQAHLSLALRIRDEFITVLSQELIEILSMDLKRIHGEMDETLEQLRERVNFAAAEEMVLREICRLEPQATTPTNPVGDSAGLLRNLRFDE